MARTKKLDWSELRTLGKKQNNPISKHLNKYWPIYLQVGLTAGAFMFASPGVALAASLDASGTQIYAKIVNIGKWVIIVKGGIEIIQNVTSGDFQTAKKSFLSYLLVYGTLFALPWGMNQVETIFKNIN
jgi:hypothetical protein